MIRIPPRPGAVFARLCPVLLFSLVQALAGAQTFYWADPGVFFPRNGSFPVSAYRGNLSAVVWQETTPGGEGGEISVNLAVKQGRGGSWIIRQGIASYTYSSATSGSEPAILSAAVDDRGRIIIAAAVSAAETEILITPDLGASFERVRLEMGSESSVAPRIFIRSDGGCLLFVTRGGARESLSLYYARSDDGIHWSAFQPFVGESGRLINFLPTHTSLNGREFVIFQSQIEGEERTFQLYFKSSGDHGRTWTNSARITSFRDPVLADVPPDQMDNQRAHLSVQQGRLFAVWERRRQVRSPQIYGAYLSENGALAGAPWRINYNDAYCNNPLAVEIKGNTSVIWFDNSQGSSNRIMLSTLDQGGWSVGTDLSGGAGGEAAFGRPVLSGDNLSVFWQSTRGNQNRVYALEQDLSVIQPRLAARNFVPGRRTRGSSAVVGWQAPRSVSIRGYAWSWSRSASAEPPREIMSASPVASLEQTVTEDGTWYFTLIAQDFSDAWSDPVRLVFIRDTTPPPAAQIIVPETDDAGYLVSNTFSMRWNTPPASDIAGYTWNLEFLGPASLMAESGEELNRLAAARFGAAGDPPRTILGPGTLAAFTNQDNGLWVFTVAAVDQVGNIGAPARYYFKTNKYIPYTLVNYAEARQNEEGSMIMRILGRGFTEGGTVSRVILEGEGLPPREYSLDRKEFTVVSDREIGGMVVNDLPQGLYRIILEHPRRGTYTSPPVLTVDRTGTVKYGDYTQTWRPSWAPRYGRRFPLDISLLILAAILVFCALGFTASVRGLGGVAAESAAIRLETIALLTGDIMPSEKKKRITRIRRRGGGLRLKMASFTIGLVILVVVMISSPLYVMMGRTQEATLLQGLYDRAAVLLEGIATGAKPYMPGKNYLELGYLPSQSAVVPEAHYLTITGYGDEATIHSDYVMATNDGDILSRIDTAELEIGRSRLSDPLTSRQDAIAEELNGRARTEVGEFSGAIAGLNRESNALLDNIFLTAEQTRRIEEIADNVQSLQNRVNESLGNIGREVGSEPAFSTASLAENTADNYIFFKPILYRMDADDLYYRGLVRLEVSIESIVRQIRSARWSILRVIAVIALAAIAIGTIAALVLSSLVIRPIIRLVSHVERIRDTEDKTKLEGVDIEIKSKDELAVLGNTINDMTHGLVKAAAAASDLSLGKEIQKKFIPLEVNRDGNKLTSGFKDTKNVQFFGYYEGAKGVSGDYFDYQDLDGRYFAIIKCDVAGKGIPAALIMIQVATMFISYFRRWKAETKGFHIEDLVYQINDFLENLGFKGRFAAFTLCLFDSQTGIARFCNAGDNIVHWYDASEGKVKTVTLPETPATGVLPNFLVESKGGYSVQSLTIDHGDILFLYTDGIEEAKRRFRSAAFEEILCEEGEKDTPHATHTVGQGDEEMGPDRVEGIINAVMNKEVYTLHKYHNPEGEDHDLAFDFTGCEGKVEEVIMAMVSVEKMFRLYKNPKTGGDARVLVDKKVDEFLRKRFRQYREYCYDTQENPGNDAYMYYTYVREDDQYDDLTILGVYRK
ncbi:MAG: SpoIIE family protein phosphatase [Treponema sp.]|jgi:serine phosphatase RsbU (regulator of sigma subunit)|nr:SpoIIE family protein phosphatase [Treponema sp.]